MYENSQTFAAVRRWLVVCPLPWLLPRISRGQCFLKGPRRPVSAGDARFSLPAWHLGKKHQACTNVSSQLIKENIRYVLQSEYKDKVIIRTPLIPTMSATDENIHQIVKFLIQINPEVKYEMLNYNPLASAKYELVNLKYGLESYQMFTKQQMQHFYDVALQAGIKNLIKE